MGSDIYKVRRIFSCAPCAIFGVITVNVTPEIT